MHLVSQLFSWVGCFMHLKSVDSASLPFWAYQCLCKRNVSVVLDCKTLGLEAIWMLAGFVCVSVCLWKYLYLVSGSCPLKNRSCSVSYTFQKISLRCESINLAYIKDEQCCGFANESSISGLPEECLLSEKLACLSARSPVKNYTWALSEIGNSWVQGHSHPVVWFFFHCDCTEQESVGSIKSSCVKVQKHFAVWTPTSWQH